ncbi:uncharacterized protein LOC126057448 [Elephas maximus indicus]|uniref:uncharacterized protein LOC126057448 n=1 Tax=Elephas maximus indicus TaxID=99487 RepID=UPI0021172865|nr:uncharacterized protein LOC126057448 [Elephas maximus indicus]
MRCKKPSEGEGRKLTSCRAFQLCRQPLGNENQEKGRVRLHRLGGSAPPGIGSSSGLQAASPPSPPRGRVWASRSHGNSRPRGGTNGRGRRALLRGRLRRPAAPEPRQVGAQPGRARTQAGGRTARPRPDPGRWAHSSAAGRSPDPGRWAHSSAAPEPRQVGAQFGRARTQAGGRTARPRPDPGRWAHSRTAPGPRQVGAQLGCGEKPGPRQVGAQLGRTRTQAGGRTVRPRPDPGRWAHSPAAPEPGQVGAQVGRGEKPGPGQVGAQPGRGEKPGPGQVGAQPGRGEKPGPGQVGAQPGRGEKPGPGQVGAQPGRGEKPGPGQVGAQPGRGEKPGPGQVGAQPGRGEKPGPGQVGAQPGRGEKPGPGQVGAQPGRGEKPGPGQVGAQPGRGEKPGPGQVGAQPGRGEKPGVCPGARPPIPRTRTGRAPAPTEGDLGGELTCPAGGGAAAA